jgi:hypothetical protein
MTAEEYAAAQAAITAEVAAQLLTIAQLFQAPVLTLQSWEQFLDLLYPFVLDARRRSAELGRRFYDAQRGLHAPDAPRFPVYLAEYRREWFSEAMRPARQQMLGAGSSPAAVSTTVLRALKEVENGGRRTILRPVREDPVVKGWARVATGAETCAFCLMLVSRGPVYQDAESAGLNVDDTSAIELIEEGDTESLDELMTKWHPGCDCKVVPVFDRANWPGRDAYLRAEQIWREVTRGHRGWDMFLAFRRYIESDEADIAAFAVAA